MDDLFAQPPLLSWLPGETLFSLVSRHHYFRANPISASTCAQFFGHPRAGTQHDFPSCLREFVTRTDGRFGSVEEIARRHTLLAYYGAFASEDEVRHLVGRMASQNVAHLKLRLGILTSRFRANHPLKACRGCVEADRSTFGWAYWHLEHQYPGVWVCREHDQLLRESDLKSNGVGRFLWHLPSEMPGHLPNEDRDISLTAIEPLRALADTVLQLTAAASDKEVDLSSAHEVYRVELARRGWITQSGSMRMPKMVESFLQYVQPLRTIAELQTLPQTPQTAAAQLGRIFRPPRSGIHPLRHAVVCNWLFGGLPHFLEHAQTDRNATGIAKANVLPDRHTQKFGDDHAPHQRLLRLLTEQRLSLRKAALTLGIDVGTAIVWATAAGVQVRRRPKKLAGPLRRTAISALRKGADKAMVAKNAGVSVGTITKLLFGEVGLHAAWLAARQTAAQSSMRQGWLDTMAANPELGTKYLRSLSPAAYAWLYRHDRNWLQAHQPADIRALSQAGKARVHWDERDRELSAAVERAAHQLVTVNGQKKLMLWQLCQALPEIRAKLNALARLPLTKRVIDRVLHKGASGRGQRADLLVP